MQNANWITLTLALGGRILPTPLSILEFKITRVIDLRSEERDNETLFRNNGIEFLHLPTPDFQPPSQEMLWEGVNWSSEGMKQGGRVLVHCEQGIGRSAVLACCILVRQGLSPNNALNLVKTVRPIVSPSPDQLRALVKWSEDWYAKSGQTAQPVTWDQLAQIAYRDRHHSA